jgi:hypothetical protein
MAFYKICERSRHLAHLQIAAPTQFAGDILGNIFRPPLGRVEGDDTVGIAVLATQQVLDDGLKVGTS